MTTTKTKILAFGGSLRKDSYSKALLLATVDMFPDTVEVEVFDRLGEFPLFNQEIEANLPEVVKELKDKIKAADAVLICTPEYNYSVPGFLKNALDWISRPYGDASLNDKPVAIMSSSPGMLGGSRAQYHLRQTMVFFNAHVINKPEVIVGAVHEKIKDGVLTDEVTKEKIKELVGALVVWAARLKTN